MSAQKMKWDGCSELIQVYCQRRTENSVDMKTKPKPGGRQSPSCHFGFHQTESRLVDTVYKDVDKVLTPVSKSCHRVNILIARPSKNI